MVLYEDNDNELICSVADQGSSLVRDEMERIFLPFEQCANAYSASGTLGIGLSISKELVRLHGGEIRAIPNKPKGTIVEFNIPLGEGING